MLTPLRSSLVLLLLWSFWVPASGRAEDARFEELRARASRLDSLGPFLERYLGTCKDELSRSDCEENVRVQRRGLDRGVYAAVLTEQTLDIVRVIRTPSGHRFVVTPFIDGGGIALTHGEPRRQDAEGRPIIGLLVLDGTLPHGMDELALESALRTGRLELEVVFRPEGTWRLRRKGENGFYEGVKARFLGLRLTESRTGAELASRVY